VIPVPQWLLYDAVMPGDVGTVVAAYDTVMPGDVGIVAAV